MVDIVERAEILDLLDGLSAQKEKLLAHELEMLAHLKEKYEEPITGTFDDKICLEVMLRNIEIRQKSKFDRQRDQRSIDLERKS